MGKSIFDMSRGERRAYFRETRRAMVYLEYRKLCPDDLVEVGYIDDNPDEVIISNSNGAGELSLDYDEWVHVKQLLDIDEHSHDAYEKVNAYIESTVALRWTTPSVEQLSEGRY